jgi:hypothetical protein
VLARFLHTVDQHPQFYWVIGGTVLALFLIVLLRDTLNSKPPRPKPGVFISDAMFFVGVVLVLLAWRWPYLCAQHELSPDESQQIAGAITLLRDPVFWRSVDGHTAGPVNFYLLTIPHLLGGSVGYTSTRAIGLLLVAITLFSAYRLSLHAKFGEATARLGILPALLFFALAVHWDYVHFSTEHVPIALLSASCWLLAEAAKARRAGAANGYAFAAGLLAGLAPWAKLQVVPAVAAIAVCSLGTAYWAKRYFRFAAFATGTVLPTVGFVALAAGTDQLHVLWQSYISNNAGYVQQGGGWWLTVQQFAQVLQDDPGYPAFFCYSVVSACVATLLWLCWDRRSWGVPLACMACSIALFIIIVPGRAFPHYLLLSIVPLTALSAMVLEQLSRDPLRSSLLWCLISAALVPTLWFLGCRLKEPRPYRLENLASPRAGPQHEVVAEVRRFAAAGDTLGMWGWYPEYYVTAKLPQATRDAHTQRLIEDSPNRRDNLDRYLTDLKRSQPAVFIDAVGPNSFGYQDRGRYAHETVPELRKWIRENYRLIRDVGIARIYVRTDRLPHGYAQPH